jgi:hypothetical protein
MVSITAEQTTDIPDGLIETFGNHYHSLMLGDQPLLTIEPMPSDGPATFNAQWLRGVSMGEVVSQIAAFYRELLPEQLSGQDGDFSIYLMPGEARRDDLDLDALLVLFLQAPFPKGMRLESRSGKGSIGVSVASLSNHPSTQWIGVTSHHRIPGAVAQFYAGITGRDLATLPGLEQALDSIMGKYTHP